MASRSTPASVRFMLVGASAFTLVNFREPLLRAVLGEGAVVHVVAAAIDEDQAISERLAALGVHAHSVPFARAGLNPLEDLQTLVALTKLMRRERPDVVLCYTIKPVVWGLLAAWLAGVPRRFAMITGIGYAFTEGAGLKRMVAQRFARMLYRGALLRSHKVFFQNPDDRRFFRESALISDQTPTTVVNGSGVDLDQFPERPLPPGPPKFLMIARLLGDKGVREYAAAAGIVRQRFPGTSFHLVGGADPNPNCITQAELDVWTARGDIIWHGAQSDVRPFLADSHVFVLPSYREGTPRAVLEAMATGRPIITTDAPGCRETVIDGTNGFLVPPRSDKALAAAMIRMLEAPGLIGDMSSESLKLAREKYDADLVSAVMLDEMQLTGAK